MKIALAQIEVIAGNPDANVKKIIDYINKAKSQNVDIVAFPELCVGGYLVGDKYNDDNFCEWLMSYNDLIREASDGIAVFYGNVYIEKNHTKTRGEKELWIPNKDGRKRKYNAAYGFQNKKPLLRCKDKYNFLYKNDSYSLTEEHIQPKTLLPNYRFFDDERYFFSLLDISKDEVGDINLEKYYQPFLVQDKNGSFVKIGVELCEDLWCKDYRRHEKTINPTAYLLEAGAEAIINLSASPWTYEKNASRDNAVEFVCKDAEKNHNVKFKPFFYVNKIGVQNNGKNFITFDGGSTIYNQSGKLIKTIEESYKEDLLIENIEQVEFELPFKRKTKDKIEEKYLAIINGLRHLKNIFSSNTHPKWVIGLSGGIDSSVVAALLVDAFGKEKVIGVNIPTHYNSQKTKDVAKKLAETLGIKYCVVPIEDIFISSQTQLLKAKLSMPSSLNEENEQARIRGSIVLSGLAAREGALFTNNGNKLETALGYATLYGDVGGAITPLGDLTKEEVFEIAGYINKKHQNEVIPYVLIPNKMFKFSKDQIQPSAELKENQIDPFKFLYHSRLLEYVTSYKLKSINDILNSWLDKTLHISLAMTKEHFISEGINDSEEFIKDLTWFFEMFNKAVFKRIQSPPIIITSKTAFGYDLRESQLPYCKNHITESLIKEVKKTEKYFL